jgi:hypothetical protein
MAIFKAIADRISNHLNTPSIFKDDSFWLKQGIFFPKSKYKVDGWHISNSIFISASIGLAFSGLTLTQWWLYIILGTEFILIFNLCYNKILKK